jgi:hypothetical protein
MKPFAGWGLVVLMMVSAVSAEVPAAGLKIRPIQYISTDRIPDDLTLPIDRAGFQIRYLVEGEHLAALDSVEIDSIRTSDGVELSRPKNGKPTHRVGDSPMVSDDGKYCLFTLEISQGPFGRVEELTIQGQLTLLCGDELINSQIELVEGQSPRKIEGPFVISLVRSKASALSPAAASPTAANSKPTTQVPREPNPREGVPRDSDADILLVEIVGTSRILKGVEIRNGNDVLTPGATINQPGRRSYVLPADTPGKLAVSIRYWNRVRAVKLPIGSPMDSKDMRYLKQLRQILDEIRAERARPAPDLTEVRKKAGIIGAEVNRVMKNEASRDYPAKQNLLWAARDELPRMLATDLLKPSKAEESFEARLKEAAMWLGEK